MAANGSGRPLRSLDPVRCNDRATVLGRPAVGTHVLTLTQRIEAGAEPAAHASPSSWAATSASPSRTARLHDPEPCAYAANLQALGVAPGDHVALLGPTRGRSSPPSRPSGWPVRPSWCSRSRCACRRSRSSWHRPACGSPTPTCRSCSSTRTWRRSSSPARRPAMVGLGAVQPGPAVAGARRWDRPADDLDRLAILQFTSGSTSDPKGVMLPHHTVGANLDAIAQATSLDPDDDVLVSWLPLYHDMGLVGLFTLPMTTGTRPRARRAHRLHGSPSRWMEWISTYGGTATAGPNFSYVLAAKRCAASDGSTSPGCASPQRRRARSTRPPSRPSSRRRAARPPSGRGLPRLRHGRGGHRRHVPRADVRAAHRSVDQRVLETERYAAPVDPAPTAPAARHPGPAGPRPRDPRRRPDHRRRARSARWASSRSAAPR